MNLINVEDRRLALDLAVLMGFPNIDDMAMKITESQWAEWKRWLKAKAVVDRLGLQSTARFTEVLRDRNSGAELSCAEYGGDVLLTITPRDGCAQRVRLEPDQWTALGRRLSRVEDVA